MSLFISVLKNWWSGLPWHVRICFFIGAIGFVALFAFFLYYSCVNGFLYRYDNATYRLDFPDFPSGQKQVPSKESADGMSCEEALKSTSGDSILWKIAKFYGYVYAVSAVFVVLDLLIR